ncbi:response regulator [Rhizobium halophytocola]|uniref:Two-component system response regulator n=1 Tax=Rhizobium halophytocola TaxID=735519 RepID=A0ABS4E076_9HYPH|nr:HD domain-containing phosphohydrolase [Rhizobium halophytocola]MBP1851346.1 putative two-component system response regulator [Rhizobium halophytocola]
MRILLVDDNATNLKLLTRLVAKLGDCEALPYASPDQVLSALPDLDFDVAIIDYQMPVYNGVELYTEIARFDKYADVPVIFVTADTDQTTRMDALNIGAIDFLTKPVHPAEFQTRVNNIVGLTRARHKLAAEVDGPHHDVDDAVAQLRQREEEIVRRLSLAAYYKDPERGRHSGLVAAYARAIAGALGLPAETCRDIGLAAPLRDIAQVAAPDTVMLKQGKLTESEFRQIQSQASRTRDNRTETATSLLSLAAEISASYHERFDGQGYPNRLSGEAIPVSGRIVAIASAFDALTTERPFKTAWSFEQAAAHIEGRASVQFDPACAAAFADAADEIRAVFEADRRERAADAASGAAHVIGQKIA